MSIVRKVEVNFVVTFVSRQRHLDQLTTECESGGRERVDVIEPHPTPFRQYGRRVGFYIEIRRALESSEKLAIKYLLYKKEHTKCES